MGAHGAGEGCLLSPTIWRDCFIAMGTDGFPLVSHGYRELAF